MSKGKLIKGSIDLMKIEKSAIFESKNGGKYINVDIWVNDEEDNYGNNVGIKQSIKVDDNKYESHFIGNGKKKFGFSKSESAAPVDAVPIPKANTSGEAPTDDLPF